MRIFVFYILCVFGVSICTFGIMVLQQTWFRHREQPQVSASGYIISAIVFLVAGLYMLSEVDDALKTSIIDCSVYRSKITTLCNEIEHPFIFWQKVRLLSAVGILLISLNFFMLLMWFRGKN
jgi:hypothetical protein